MLASIRRAFFAGIVLLAPLVATVYVFNLLVSAIGGRFRTSFFSFVPETLLSRPNLQILWNFLATLLVLAIITALGYLTRFVLTRFLVHTTERVIHRLPIINSIYGSVKQVVQTFSAQQRAISQQVVLIEYPREGVWVLGCLTSTAKGEAQARTSAELFNIFVPTTPNPTSGFLLMVPKDQIIPMNMSVGDGMKVIISGGAVVPDFNIETMKNVSLFSNNNKPQVPSSDEPV